MGLYVNYINILKNGRDEKACVDAIIACMQKNGYRIAAEVKDVEVKLILVNDNESKWFTVTQEESEFSEDFLFENADKYANAFGSYALSVLVADSDFMMLYLTDGKSIKEKYYLGIVEDYISASNDSDLAYLENLVENKENIPLISEAFNKEYVFIEEALMPIGDALGFDNSKIMSGIFDDIDNEENVETIILGFK